jgi:hypothetical protein
MPEIMLMYSVSRRLEQNAITEVPPKAFAAYKRMNKM